jgi:hypothetical protein
VRRVRRGLCRRRHRALAPRRHRHLRPLGEALGAQLVAKGAHHAAARPDEDQAQPLAQRRQLRVPRDQPPADPHRLGARREQGALHRSQAQTGALAVAPRGEGAGAQAHALIGLADKARLPIRLAVKGDDAQRRPVRELAVQLAHGVDKPHGGLTAVDDGQTLEVGSHDSS